MLGGGCRQGSAMNERPTIRQRLTGRIAAERIKLMRVPRLPEGLARRYAALPDATGLISDVMDELGLAGRVIGASVLRPTIPGKIVVGPALTVRNERRDTDIAAAARSKLNRMAEFEAHNLAQPGDVLVIEGVANVSNMGGISAQTGWRQGEIGAIVMGGIRDLGHSRKLGYPIWASDITPATGKWRIETVEINGTVRLGGVEVNAGDLVVADDTGVCFVPTEHMVEVIKLAESKAKAEIVRGHAIEDGLSVPDIADANYGQR